jgi:hypothetical protein
MTMPRWTKKRWAEKSGARKWICATVGAALLAIIANRAAVAVQTESTTGDEATTEAAETLAQPSVVEAQPETQLPPSTRTIGGNPWDEHWIDETMDDAIPVVWSHWTINLDVLLWRRKGPTDLQLTNPNAGPAFNAQNLEFDHEAGPRLALIRRGISGWDVELNYFGFEGFQSEFTATPPTPLASVNPRVPADDPGGLYINDIFGPIPGLEARFRYQSRLQSEELNLRRELNQTWTGLIGFRAVQIHENFHVDYPTNSALYSIESENRLYGMQIGGEGKLFYTDNFLISTVLKAGLFENNSEQTTTDISGQLSNRLAPFSIGGATNQASFVGELGVMGTYRWTESVLFRLGYNVMWIDDIALATEQIAVNEFRQIPTIPDIETVNAEGSLFYHGVTFGVELTW